MIKRTLLLIVGLLYTTFIFSQAPGLFNYQAVVRNSSGDLITNSDINFRISIREGSSNGTTVFSETQLVQSNSYGVCNLKIGDGSNIDGSIPAIDWSSGTYFLQIETDVSGGESFTETGTVQLLSVPYAMYANAVSNTDDADADTTNEIQDLDFKDNILTITKNQNATGISLAAYQGTNTDNQTLDLTGANLTISDGNTIDVSSLIDADADPTNELQNLTFSGDTLSIENGNHIVFPYDSSRWAVNGQDIYYKTGNVGIGSSSPRSKLEVKADASFTADDTLFSVKDKDGKVVFAVFNDGVKVYVNEGVKGNVGGFAVSGRGTGKATEYSVLNITPDSARFYLNNTTKGTPGGFAVSGRGTGKDVIKDYLQITPDSTRIYINDDTKGQPGGFAVSGRGTGKTNSVDYFNVSGAESSNMDSINPSRAGMLWYPKSEAFLVGRVLVEHPDSVGINSMATGYESKAIGDYSQALGYKSIARSDYATAIGKNALANGLNSFAFGENAEAYSSESYSFGRGAKSYGYRSFAFGSSGVDSSGVSTGVTQAKGNYSFAIGQGSITGIDLEDCPPKPPKYPGTQEEYWKIYYSGEGAVAIGVGDSSLASYATTLGYYNTASYGSVALGYKNKAYGMHSAILGGYSNTINSESSAIVGGHDHIIDAPYAAVLGGIRNKVHSGAAWGVIGGGTRNEIYGSTSTIVNGTYNVATGNLSTVMGSRNNAYSWCETVIGQYNDYNASGIPDEWISTDHLFVIGNGTKEGGRSNAMVVLKNGNVGVGTNPGTYKLHVDGGDAYFSGDVSALSITDRTKYPKDLETAYKAVLSMNRLPDGEYDENNKENQLDHSTLHSFVTSSDGKHRDLSATVSAQNEVIKDLVKQIEDIKSENELLKQKLNEIIELLKLE